MNPVTLVIAFCIGFLTVSFIRRHRQRQDQNGQQR